MSEITRFGKTGLNKPMWPIADLIPHSRTMVLLQKLENYGDNYLQASLRISPQSLFLNSRQHVPAWVGIEYMAQAIAAYAGVKARKARAPIKVGLLIGTRKYLATKPAFKIGELLQVRVSPLHEESSGLGVFQCEIKVDDEVRVAANLNVYQPPNISEFMAEVGL